MTRGQVREFLLSESCSLLTATQLWLRLVRGRECRRRPMVIVVVYISGISGILALDTPRRSVFFHPSFWFTCVALKRCQGVRGGILYKVHGNSTLMTVYRHTGVVPWRCKLTPNALLVWDRSLDHFFFRDERPFFSGPSAGDVGGSSTSICALLFIYRTLR